MLGKINVTGCSLETLVRQAYNLSGPQGLGFLHYKDGSLADETVASIIERGKGDKTCAVGMDYVNGRSCKFYVYRGDGGLWVKNNWYDHSTRDLEELLKSVGVGPEAIAAARKEQEDDDNLKFQAAVAFLEERNGVFVEPSYGEPGDAPEDVQVGFYIGSDRRKIRSEYKDVGVTKKQHWFLVAEM